MLYEVEQKFRVPEFQPVESRLAAWGIAIGPAVEQIDRYFAHPVRDFCVTDEAFRLRRSGANNWATYKGPRIDATTKTRQEIELPLPEGGAYFEQFTGMLEALGFRRVAEVVKRRRKAYLPAGGRSVELSLDEVERLGTYVELELIAPESEVPAARDQLSKIAEQLGLVENERRSYLTLLQALS